MTPIVASEREGRVTVVTIDDGRVNALDPGVLAELSEVVARAQAERDAIVLAGRPGYFSAGLDLRLLRSGVDNAADLLRSGFELAERLLMFPAPVVMACTGHAIAMGSFLLLTGDHRVGSDDDSFRIQANEVAIGSIIPHGAAVLCRRRLTAPACEQATILAASFTHRSAVTAGWLDEACPPDQVIGRAVERAASFVSSLDGRAFAANKRRLHASLVAEFQEAIQLDDRDVRSWR